MGSLRVFFSSIVAAATFVIAAPKPLTVWIMPNGASPKEKIEQRLELFTQKTGIPTVVQVLDWGEAWNRISTALASQQGAPDILQLGTTWVPYFAANKQLKPLNPWLKEINPNRFAPVSWNTTHIDGDTTIYSLPWFIDVRLVLANKKILKENNIDSKSIATYEGFAKAIKKVNEAKKILSDGSTVQGYAFPGKSDWNIPHNFAPWIWSNGGSFISKDENGKWSANILSEQTLLGINSYLAFIKDSLVNPEVLQYNTAQIAQHFNNGELAFIINTSEILMQIRYEGSIGGLAEARIGSDSLMALPIPTGAQGSVSFIGGSNLAIPAGNTRPEAKDLLQFLVRDDNLDAYTKQIGLLPTSKAVLNDWAKDGDYVELVKALETGRTYATIPEWGAIEQTLVNMFSSIWELMEIPALYSDEKIYSIFKQYTEEINKILNVPSNDIMTVEEFKAVMHKNEGKGNIASSSNESNDTRKNNAIAQNIKVVPVVFAVMVLLGFIFSLRKRKK
ncbi:MAG: extracellular solute-binding protein [Fibrobacter sp.]|nr:extracellular solute-binding protein [Fibrobacter sp.]